MSRLELPPLGGVLDRSESFVRGAHFCRAPRPDPTGAGGRDSISVNRDLSLAETLAAGRFKVRCCPRMHEAAHKLNG